MVELTFDKLFKTLKEYLFMASGMIFYSFGWVACILPYNGTGGGASGLALVLCKALAQAGIADIRIGTMVLIINVALLLISGFIVGWNFGIKTVYCVVVLSLSMNMWLSVLPEGNFLGLQDQIVAIVLGGVSASFTFRLRASSGLPREHTFRLTS